MLSPPWPEFGCYKLRQGARLVSELANPGSQAGARLHAVVEHVDGVLVVAANREAGTKREALDCDGEVQTHVQGSARIGARLHAIVEHVDGVLVVAADGEVGVALHIAARGVEVARHELQQRALARAVGADERDARVAVDAELQVLFRRTPRMQPTQHAR